MSDAARAAPLPIVQFAPRPGTIDLGWGHPDPDLLPIDALREAGDEAARRWGPDLYAYGYAGGPGPLVDWLTRHIGEIDGRAPGPGELLVTAGASNALDLVITLAARPGDVALVESPTYHIAVKLLRDHGLERVAIPRDDDGPRLADLEATLDRLEAEHRRAALLYTIPTFHNPTGVVTPVARREALLRLAEERGLLLVEDDAYRELHYAAPPPPSLWSLGRPGAVARVGSFSKTLAPGLRAGFLTADAALVERLADGGLLDSGGGIAHIPGLTIAVLGERGDYARHVEALRAAYRSRRDALLAGLAGGLPGGSPLRQPDGGFFAWVTLPEDVAAARVLELAEERGASFMVGGAFALDGGVGSSLRLSFSRYAPAALERAGRIVGEAAARAVEEASVRRATTRGSAGRSRSSAGRGR